MRTRTTELIEQTMRQWDDYAAIEDEERLECVMADVERQRARKTKAPYSADAEPLVMEPGYTITRGWDTIESL